MISLISIILEIGFYNYIKADLYILPLFTLLSIILLKKDKYYLFKCFGLGVLYDLVFTDLYIVDGIIYLLFGFIIKNIKVNIINNILISVLFIIFYQVLLFIIFNITKYQIYSINELLFIIPHYFIINIIYIIISSFIMHKIK